MFGLIDKLYASIYSVLVDGVYILSRIRHELYYIFSTLYGGHYLFEKQISFSSTLSFSFGWHNHYFDLSLACLNLILLDYNVDKR